MLTQIVSYDKRRPSIRSPDKAKLFVRRGQKAAGLLEEDGRATEGGTKGKLGFFVFDGGEGDGKRNFFIKLTL